MLSTSLLLQQPERPECSILGRILKISPWIYAYKGRGECVCFSLVVDGKFPMPGAHIPYCCAFVTPWRGISCAEGGFSGFSLCARRPGRLKCQEVAVYVEFGVGVKRPQTTIHSSNAFCACRRKAFVALLWQAGWVIASVVTSCPLATGGQGRKIVSGRHRSSVAADIR